MIIVAPKVTTYVSNKSAAMPAQSPTLSPTLSAMTAGLRGSSSGMSASTLPTRSAPTSAALVKIPPPSRAKIDTSDAPSASAISAVTTGRLSGRYPPGPVRYQKKPASAISARPATSMPVIAPARNAIVNPACRLVCAAAAVRTLARTDTFMPIKPVAPDSVAPITKPIAAIGPMNTNTITATITPTSAIARYWRFR